MRQEYLLPGWAIARHWPRVGSDLSQDGAYPVVEEWEPDRWRVTVAAERVAVDQANPYGWIPYVVIPNNPDPLSFWGRSDLEDLYDVCRSLNQRLSVLDQILDMSGMPVAVIENVDAGGESLQMRPGAKWELPENAKAYLLDLLAGGGVGLHIDAIEELRRALHDLAETPRTAFGDSGRELSGVALEVEIQPLTQKVRRKRRVMERAYRERNARLLDLMERFGGQSFGGLRRTEPVWPPILPSDDETQARMETALVAAGVRARRTAMAELGVEDPEAEWLRVLEERAGEAAIAAAHEDDDDADDEDADDDDEAADRSQRDTADRAAQRDA
ncbi:MAG TPA: phage portal protein [Miltoncostaeaceae bacterium]|nr:phage portal protein [Miltoncostaeaceae bacterium]